MGSGGVAALLNDDREGKSSWRECEFSTILRSLARSSAELEKHVTSTRVRYMDFPFQDL
jgi:hypothetical protein